MKSLELLKSLNPWLANGSVPAQEYDILVMGKPVTENGKVTKIKFSQTTNPRADAAEAGVEKGKYLRASFTRSGGITTSEKRNGVDSFRGSKKAQAGNIFERTQPELYNFVVGKLRLGEGDGYDTVNDNVIVTLADGKTEKMIQVRVKATVWGSKITLTVPKYKLTTRDANGKRIAFTGPQYDPKTDTYKKQQNHRMAIDFFADIDDLEFNLEQLAVSLYERQVQPYEVGETTVTVTKSNETTTKKETAPVVDNDPNAAAKAQEEQNQGDEGNEGEDDEGEEDDV